LLIAFSGAELRDGDQRRGAGGAKAGSASTPKSLARTCSARPAPAIGDNVPGGERLNMSTTAAAPPPMVAQFLQTFGMEHATTLRVLKAVPGDKLSFKPHERSFSAGELAWHIAYSQLGLAKFIVTHDFASYQQPPVPASIEEIVAGSEKFHNEACEVISRLTQEQLAATIPLPGGKSVPASGMLWGAVLFHQIHHRGQLSVYIRMTGGKVPSIYGPSGDDNPFA